MISKWLEKWLASNNEYIIIIITIYFETSAFIHAELGLTISPPGVNNQLSVALSLQELTGPLVEPVTIVFWWVLEQVFGDWLPFLASTSCRIGKKRHWNSETSLAVVEFPLPYRESIFISNIGLTLKITFKNQNLNYITSTSDLIVKVIYHSHT